MTPLWLALSAAHADPENNPHAPLRQDPVPEGACGQCHAGEPAAGDPKLHLPPEKVCASCHQDERHPGVATHLGQTVDAATRERLAKAAMPLLGDGTIGCVTCHDPHPAPENRAAQAPPGWWTLRFGASAPGSDLVRQPGGALCVTCHPITGIVPSRGSAPKQEAK